MSKKTSENPQTIMTDAFLREPYNPNCFLQNALKSNIAKKETKPINLKNQPEFVTAIKAARRKTRKIFTKKLCLRLIGLTIIFIGFLVLFASCRVSEAPIEISAQGFYPADNASASTTNNEYFKHSQYKKFQSPIVGIIHPYKDINENNTSHASSSTVTYELADKTTITEIGTDDSRLERINSALQNNDDREARKLISAMILQGAVSQELEITLLGHLRVLNSKLLQSTASDGDAKFVTVRKGDTVWKFAQQYRTTPEAIGMLNQIDIDKIKVGQKLKVFKSPFNLIAHPQKNCIYLWKDDHIVKRYDAKIIGLNTGSYRLRNQRKGANASIVYSGDIMLAPISMMTTIAKTIKIDLQDYNELAMLLVTDSILQVN